MGELARGGELFPLKMAAKAVLVTQQLSKPIRVLKWKVGEGSAVSIGRVILLYDFEGGEKREQRRLKSLQAGTVSRLVAQEDAIVKPGAPLLELAPCLHPTIMKDMCAECGADLRKDDLTTSASIPMVHAIPELKVSEELAQKLGKADGDRLLKDRKLVLLVDLDQTIIHTTNDNIPPNIKDVYHFQLYGPNSPWYHTRLRPGTHKFLKNVAPFFELHICTFGARNYAHTITTFLDGDHAYFSNRILSRDECFDPTSKKANLKALFPCGDDMVCIIDDREDVWSHASNLIHVKPYHFFQHTGDINAPPGLDKHENDDDGSPSWTKMKIKTRKKLNGSISQRNGKDLANRASHSKDGGGSSQDKEECDEEKPAKIPRLDKEASEMVKNEDEKMEVDGKTSSKEISEDGEETAVKSDVCEDVEMKEDLPKEIIDRDSKSVKIDEDSVKIVKNSAETNESGVKTKEESVKTKEENVKTKEDSVKTKEDCESHKPLTTEGSCVEDLSVDNEKTKENLESELEETCVKIEDDKSATGKTTEICDEVVSKKQKIIEKTDETCKETNEKKKINEESKNKGTSEKTKDIEENPITCEGIINLTDEDTNINKTNDKIDEKESKTNDETTLVKGEIRKHTKTKESDETNKTNDNVKSKSETNENDKNKSETNENDKNKMKSNEIPENKSVENKKITEENRKGKKKMDINKMNVDKNKTEAEINNKNKREPLKQKSKALLKNKGKSTKGSKAHKKQQTKTKENNENKDETKTDSKENEETDQNKKDELIEVEDTDDYLLYLEEILKRIHMAFYEEYDKLESGNVPDLKKVIPTVRSQVLKGTKLVFSGLVPTHIKLEQSKAYQVARSLGACITQDIEKDTTHLVAVRPGTAKVNAGRRNKKLKIVTPDWLWACAERWQHLEEKIYPLSSKGSKNRHPPAHVSPEHIPNYLLQDEKTGGRKRTASGRFMDTINPLMSFSTNELADMDKEVESMLLDEDDDDTDSDDDMKKIKKEVLKASSNKDDSSSSDNESLSGEFPLGYKRLQAKDIHKNLDEEELDADSSLDEFPSARFRRGEQLESDLDIGQESNTDGSDDPIDEVDDGEWNMMGAALEREFLSNQ